MIWTIRRFPHLPVLSATSSVLLLSPCLLPVHLIALFCLPLPPVCASFLSCTLPSYCFCYVSSLLPPICRFPPLLPQIDPKPATIKNATNPVRWLVLTDPPFNPDRTIAMLYFQSSCLSPSLPLSIIFIFPATPLSPHHPFSTPPGAPHNPNDPGAPGASQKDIYWWIGQWNN